MINEKKKTLIKTILPFFPSRLKKTIKKSIKRFTNNRPPEGK